MCSRCLEVCLVFVEEARAIRVLSSRFGGLALKHQGLYRVCKSLLGILPAVWIWPSLWWPPKLMQHEFFAIAVRAFFVRPDCCSWAAPPRPKKET